MAADIPLYWSEPDTLEALCTVLSAEKSSEDGSWELVLEASPFYPGGGGQPPDRGRIEGSELAGIKNTDGRIIHRVKSSGAFVPGDRVRCRVDGRFRRDSRQQHTGQHLLSAALASEGFRTVSVHLGEDYCGIEVEAETVPETTILQVIDLCDRWIAENRKVISRITTAADLPEGGLRRPLSEKAGSGDKAVRIVEIEGLDAVGCGGVHLESTAAIAAVQFEGSERIRGRVRLKWLIGDRVIRTARRNSGILMRLGQIFSSAAADIVPRVEALLADVQESRRQQEKTEYEMGTMLCRQAAAENPDGVAALNIGGASARMEGALNAAAETGLTAILLLGEAGDDGRIPWALRLAEAAPEDFEALQRNWLEPVGGRGGGKCPLWRGVLTAPPDTAAEAFLDYFRNR